MKVQIFDAHSVKQKLILNNAIHSAKNENPKIKKLNASYKRI